MNEDILIGEDGYYHYVYKTTNLVNGKMYIGVHSTQNLEDGYLGSGKLIRRSIRKHGKENFNRQILEFYTTRSSALDGEIEYLRIHREEQGHKQLYNILDGGQGFSGGEKHPMFGKKHSDEMRKKISERIQGKTANFKGFKHTEEAKRAIALAHSGANNYNAQPVELRGMTFDCITDGAKYLHPDVCLSLGWKRIKEELETGQPFVPQSEEQLLEKKRMVIRENREKNEIPVFFRGVHYTSIKEAAEEHFPDVTRQTGHKYVKFEVQNGRPFTFEEARKIMSQKGKERMEKYNPSKKSICFKGEWFDSIKQAFLKHYPDFTVSGGYSRIRKELAKEREFQIAGEVITADY